MESHLFLFVLHLFTDCIAWGLYDYQMCAAEVSHSSTCEVYSSKKDGNDKSCLFWGPNQIKYSFIIISENSVQSKQKWQIINCLSIKNPTRHKNFFIMSRKLYNLSFYLSIYLVWLLTLWRYNTSPYMSEYGYNNINLHESPSFLVCSNKMMSELTSQGEE